MSRTFRLLGISAVCAGIVVASQPAEAQVKGTGKAQLTIIRWNDATNQPVSTKAAGSIQTKPKLGVTGLTPTGGSVTQVKLPFDLDNTIDPLKPAFPQGDYVLQVETSSTPTGNVDTLAFIVLHMSSLGKCTADANPTVDGDAPTDWCNQPGATVCAPTIVGKCTYSTYQVAGSLAPLGPGTGVPSSSRMLLRKKVPAGNCLTGDIVTAGVEIRANDAGTFDPVNHDCGDGAVVGVIGVANGETGY